MTRSKGPGRIRRWFERVALGGIMTVVAIVVERRLIKVIRERGKAEAETKPEIDDTSRGNSAELTTPTT